MAAVTEALPARPLAGTDEALLVAQIEFTEWESYQGQTFTSRLSGLTAPPRDSSATQQFGPETILNRPDMALSMPALGASLRVKS